VKILRIQQVTELTGLSRVTVWRLERAGKFPSRIRLSANAVGWLEDELRLWLESRPRGLPQHGPIEILKDI